MRPHELLTRDCDRLQWNRILILPLVGLVLAATIHALSDPSDINWCLAGFSALILIGVWFYGWYLQDEIGFIEGEE
jgi:hypothetical protein